MSHATKFLIPVDWVIISSELVPKHHVDLKLGNVFNDVWSLKLFKKPFKKGRFHIIFSIERKRGEQRVMAIIKLKFTDPLTCRYSEVKYVKRFQNVDITRASYYLSKQVRGIFTWAKRIQVTGEVFFHLIPNSGPVASPQTLTMLSNDFSKLCCTNIFSDVILRCGSEVFPAHRNILAARCPVFDEMLENDVKKEVKVDIKDLAPHVLKAVLIFIYSGETEQLNFQSACDLLSAADKYRLKELKTLCINHITSSFSVENVLDYFHQYEVAKTYALEFINENISEIKRTKQWQNFKREFPDLVSKLEENVEIEGANAKQWKDIKQESPGTSRQWVEKQECPDTAEECKSTSQESSGTSDQLNDIKQESLGSSKQCKSMKREYSGTSRQWYPSTSE